MSQDIRALFEDFVVERWGRLIYEELCRGVESQPEAVLDEHELSNLVSHLALGQQVSFDDIVFAFGEYCFPRFAAQLPKRVRLGLHPKLFLLEMHKILSFERSRDQFVHFHYIDSAPEELLMVYKSRQTFSSFVQGFIAGAANTFAHQIECQPVTVREGDVSGCRFQLRFMGDR